MTRNQKIIFAVILAVAVFLIFFRLGRQDMLADDAHYALRAYGYFDYMASYQQTTPVQWYGERPWWSYLSFHDHPPLYFFIQFIFFKLLGAGVWISRLTSALAALGSVVVMFFLGRRFSGAALGLLAMSALTVNNYFIWQGRIGLLESLFVFWLLLGLFFLVKGLQDHSKFFIMSGIFFGAALLTKYTFLFALPAILVFLILCERRVFWQKNFWIGILLFLLVTSPLVIYNYEMYRSRGHFDVQLADVFGQSDKDWPLLGSRVGGTNFAFAETFQHLGFGMTWPYFGLVLAAFLFQAVLVWRRRERLPALPLLIFLFFFLCLAYVGGADRWLGVLAPFASLLLALFLNRLWRYRMVWALSGVLAVYSLIVILNTNHALAASQNRLWTSSFRKENLGFNQLDKKFGDILRNKHPKAEAAELVQLLWFSEIKPEAIDFSSIYRASTREFTTLIIVDVNMLWFPQTWIVDRRKLYNRFFIVATDDFVAIANGATDHDVSPLFNNNTGIYFIKSADTVKADPEIETPGTVSLLKLFAEQKIQPEIIRDDKGREAFYIYSGKFNKS